MIKFFRKTRQRLLIENKLSKYLIYAIGEIILVVLGILIALAVNNWNNEIQKEKELIVSFKSILNEIVYNQTLTENRILRSDTIIFNNQESLRLLKTQAKDSAFHLENTLKGLIRLSSLKFDLPVTLKFIAENNTKKLQNENIKRLLLKLKSEISFLDFFHDYATTQYNSLVVPYVVKKLNYAKIASQNNDVDTGIKINYTDLLEDLELANILGLKLGTDKGASRRLKELNQTLNLLEKEIQIELKMK